MLCPQCHGESRQIKDGRTAAGSQRFRCKLCGCRYTPYAKELGYDQEVRHQALMLHLEGLNLREIGRLLHVHHQTVANWMKGYANFLPQDLPPSILELEALDSEFEDAFTLDVD